VNELLQENKFRDFTIEELKPFEVEIGARSLILTSANTGVRIVFRRKRGNRALSQLLRLIDLKVSDLEEGNATPEEIAKRLGAEKGIVISALQDEMNESKFYAFRVTKEGYVPIPHRTVFDAAKEALRELGYLVNPEVVKFSKRTVAYFKLGEVPLQIASVDDAIRFWVAVSNANTGYHSLKVYGVAEILSCKNGLVHPDFVERVRIYHVHGAEEVTAIVKESVQRIVQRYLTGFDTLVAKIARLGTISVSNELAFAWLNELREKVPKTAWKRVRRVFDDYANTYGYTAAALFQTLTWIASNTTNERLSREFNDEAVRLLESPEEYLDAIPVEE